jgi:hypothetical protein
MLPSASDGDFTFVVCERRHRCPSILAECLSRRVSDCRWSTVNKLDIDVDDPDDLFEVLMGAAFRCIRKHLWRLVQQHGIEIWFETVADRIRLLDLHSCQG